MDGVRNRRFVLLFACFVCAAVFGQATGMGTTVASSMNQADLYEPLSAQPQLALHRNTSDNPSLDIVRFQATPMLQTWYVTNAQRVNVRTCGGMNCTIITEVEYGTPIYVIPPVTSGWQHIRLASGEEGYIGTGYISSIVPPAASPTLPPAPPAGGQKRYSTAEMNLRSCASINCKVVGHLVYGEAFLVTGQVDYAGGYTWYSLTKGGQTMWGAGWLSSARWPGPLPTPFPLQPQLVQPNLPQPIQVVPTWTPQPPAPVQVQPPPVAPPVQPAQPIQPPSQTGFTCDCSKTCTQINTCAEARYQLDYCGCRERDLDSDGMPCEWELCGER